EKHRERGESQAAGHTSLSIQRRPRSRHGRPGGWPFITPGRPLVPEDERRTALNPGNTPFVAAGASSVTQPLASRAGRRDDGSMVAAVLALALVVAAEPALPSPRLAVLVRIDTQELERHVRVADVIREIQTLWAPYADIDFTDLDAPSKRAYDDE